MKKINILGIFLFAVLLVACGGESKSQSNAETQDDGSEESIVENAVFTDLDGNEVTLDQYQGKLVLIDFWETWCGPCLQVFPAMQQLHEEYPDKFEVLAVTAGISEGPEEASQFVDRNEYDFVFLFDENEVFNRLGGEGIPFKIFVNPDGELISIELGSYGREADYEKTKDLLAEYFEIE